MDVNLKRKTTAYRVDPEPSAGATTRRAFREVGNFECSVQIPDTGMVDAEYGKVFGLDITGIRLVCDSERASLDIVETGRMELRDRLTNTRAVGSVSCVPTICAHAISAQMMGE